MTPDSTVQNDLLSYLGQLGPEDQARVVDFARNLTGASKPPVRAVSGKELLKFAGSISHEDAEEMIKAIEEGCEQIDASTW